MAEFYGLVQGSRGEATRMGSPASNFTAWAQDPQGRVQVLFYRDENRRNRALVELRHSSYSSRVRDSSESIELGRLDVAAIVNQASKSVEVANLVMQAREALQEASERATALDTA